MALEYKAWTKGFLIDESGCKVAVVMDYFLSSSAVGAPVWGNRGSFFLVKCLESRFWSSAPGKNLRQVRHRNNNPDNGAAAGRRCSRNSKENQGNIFTLDKSKLQKF